MDTTTLVSLIGMAVVVVGSALVNFFGAPAARSTSDFLAAGRSVGPLANAAAISGEFLSAAAFLGIAGLVLRDGADALWYPIGFTAGYLALLLFVAAPLRRSGAYSVSDFADARLGHTGLRRLCTLFTVIVGWLGMLPQLQGAGLTVATVTPLPGWVGAVAAAAVIMATMLFGGLRSMTLVQAVQFFVKTVALAVPAVIVAVLFLRTDQPPAGTFTAPTTVEVHTGVTLQVPQPVTVHVAGMADGATYAGAVTWPPGPHTVAAGTTLTFPEGAAVPVPTTGGDPEQAWLRPLTHRGEHSLLATYSLLAALFLGTIGLPNVLARFYTNPDGRTARRTAVAALALVGGFYLFPVVLGVLARHYTPQLLISGDTDAAVLLLPAGALHGLGADLLTGLVAAGAWAAFLSAGTGLAVSIAGVVHTDVLRRSGPGGFRFASVLVTVVPLLLTLRLDRLPFAETIALAFAVAASTLCPLLLLGIWWRGLTTPGAVAGMLVGGGASTAAVCLTIAGVTAPGALGVLLSQPTVVTAPAAFLVMVVVSKLTAGRMPADTGNLLLRLHAPERLGLGRPLDGDQ